MAANVIVTLCFLFLFPTPLVVCADEPLQAVEDLDACRADLRELRADINLLNLINGLHLSVDQMKGILREARSVAKDLGPVQDHLRPDPRELEEELEVLRDVRDSLNASGEIPQHLRSRYAVIHERRGAPHAAWKMKPKVLERVRQSASRVHDLLTPAQREVLTAFKACLIPPKDLKDPVRVGQAKSTSHLERYLEMIRELPDPVYANRLDEILTAAVDRAEQSAGAMKEEDRNRYLAGLKSVSERARAMSGVEFELNRRELAAELEPVDRAKILGEDLAGMGVQQYQLEGKITQFLLSPRTIPILERRLKAMKETSR